MASRNSSPTSSGARTKAQRSNRDSARWIVGLLLLFAGLFAVAAVFFSFFTWKSDQSVLAKSVEERELLDETVSNPCGWSGARLGWLLVDASLGVCGILVPVMLVLIGVRIIRKRPLLLNHSILALLLIMILGSLTLGFVFADKWSFCCSTGWGGEFGIAVGNLLRAHIGVLGTVILLAVCWFLFVLFIYSNFINTVNSAGSAMVDKSGRFVGMVKHRVATQGSDPEADPFFEEPFSEEPFAAEEQSQGVQAPQVVRRVSDAAPVASAGLAPDSDIRPEPQFEEPQFISPPRPEPLPPLSHI
ncbi:MAG: DNA translocase FtsK 4TM domain-containing protein, partial [Alistipes sp.]|nr:DNA translocase FtsK 4TM domain-containing protein [Alistipes sp.]